MIVAPRHSALWLLALAALASTSCAPLQSAARTYLEWQRPDAHSTGEEKVYSVRWWARVDQSFGLPYHPVEQGEPEVDPRGRVFAVAGDGKVHAFDSHGKPLWDYTVDSPFDAGPTWAENRLYVGAAKGQVVSLDATSGRKIWQYDVPDEIVTRPVVAGSLVLVVSAADTIYALDQAKGEWKWQYRREAPATDFTVRGASRPVVAGGKVFAGFSDGWAVALDAKDGTVAWAKDLGQGKSFADVDAGPVVDEQGRVFFASFATGVFALEAATGKLLWTTPKPGVGVLMNDPAGRWVFGGGNGFVAAWSADSGATRWSATLGTDRFVSGMALVNGILLASTGQGPLLFLDAFNGKLRRMFDPGHGVWAAPASLGAQAYVLSNRGVLYDLGIEARGRP